MIEGNKPEAILIMGVGNILMGDEGFGVHVVRKLREYELPADVRVEEGGVGGLNLLGLLEGVGRLVIVDVMNTETAPGEILLFKPGPRFIATDRRVISFHEVGVLELAQMWGLLGYEPEVFFLVTRPLAMDWNLELSPGVAAAADKAVDLLRRLCRDDFAGLERSADTCTL